MWLSRSHNIWRYGEITTSNGTFHLLNLVINLRNKEWPCPQHVWMSTMCLVVHSVSGCPQCVCLSTACLDVHSMPGCPHCTACLDVHNVSVWLSTACLDVHSVPGCPQRVWMSTLHSMSRCPHCTACLDVHNVSGCSQHVYHEGSHHSCEKNSWACKSIHLIQQHARIQCLIEILDI